jgi:hypothetical protein
MKKPLLAFSLLFAAGVLLLAVVGVLLGNRAVLADWLGAQREASPPAEDGGRDRISPEAASRTAHPVSPEARRQVSPPAAPARTRTAARRTLVPVPEEDPNSVAAILAGLRSTDQVVRLEAIERTKQIEDRSVIPTLNEIAGRMEDPREHAALLDAIAFIQLPALDMAATQRVGRADSGRRAPPPPRRRPRPPFR